MDSQSDLGDDHLGGMPAYPGDLVQAVHRGQISRRGDAVASPGVGGCLGGGDVGDHLLDAGIEAFDLRAEVVGLIQQNGC